MRYSAASRGMEFFVMTGPYSRALAAGKPVASVRLTLALVLFGLLAGCGGGGGSSSTPAPTPTVTFTLSVSTSGNGTVTSSPAGINCGSSCSASFTSGNQVTLQATPGSGYLFSGWMGACSGSSTNCAVTMNQNQSASAVFAIQTAPQAKPALIGLVTMGSENWVNLGVGGLPQNRLLEANAHPGVYVAAVIQATWSQLEPQPGVFDDSVIDDALQNIAAYNAKYPATPLVGKLRIFAGVNTPAWVMQQVGSVTLTDSAGNSATFPDFWTAQYTALWTQLQNHLAAVYDSNPAMGEVAISVCSSITAEPFVLPGDAVSQQALLAAGYSDAQMETCLSNAAQDYAAWKQTPLDYTFNPLYLTQSNPASNAGTAFTVQVMQNFRASLGTRAVVANHDLDIPFVNPADQAIYTEFQTLYAAAQAATPPTISPLEFQTAGQSVDFATLIPYAISTYHPTEIEIWNTVATGDGHAPITQAELQQWAAQMKLAN